MKKVCVEMQWRSLKKFLKGGIGAEYASTLEIAEFEFFYKKRVQEIWTWGKEVFFL